MYAVWVNLTIASRLIGLPHPVVTRREEAGRYGPIKQRARAGKPEILVSTLGIELAGRYAITPAQIAAAKAGQPLPYAERGSWLGGTEDFLYHPHRHPPPIEQIGAAVARAYHEPIEDEI